MAKKTKLELTWIGKDQRPRLEPRVLLEDSEQSYHAPHKVTANDQFDNRLIFGDNLLALKALEQEFTSKIKCIYIDPPYNTGQAFEHYDDGLEMSIWLSLMRERLLALRKLLHPEGVIFVQIDDAYFPHLRLLMDEVFGKYAYLNTISVKTKSSSGASGGGEDRRLKKNVEFLAVYSKDEFERFRPVYNYFELSAYLRQMNEEGKSFKYTTILYNSGVRKPFTTIKDGSGNDIVIFKIDGYETRSVKKVAEEENISELEVFEKYFDNIITTENAQTSIRTRVQEVVDKDNTMYGIEYYPVSGRNKGKKTELRFVGPKKRLIGWFRNVAVKRDGKIFKREKVGTLWDAFNWNNVTREGGVRFPNGQKPEHLVMQCIELSTEPGDWVLDSFAGSGTAGAVAHKMGRKWVMVELRDTCQTHIIPRLQSVVSGEDERGVTEDTNWNGGGGFRYFTLAPSLLEQDDFGNWIISKQYNAAMLAQAICKIEGFTYEPSDSVYWQHGHSTETDFIYVTTQNLTRQQIEALAEEVGPNRSLVVMCSAYRIRKLDEFPNLTLKKIPKTVLSKCEWGKDDYSLEIQELPPAPNDEPPPLRRRRPSNDEGQPTLFAMEGEQ